MQTYLAPNDTHQYTVPIMVGSEYAVPTEDAKIVVRVDGALKLYLLLSMH